MQQYIQTDSTIIYGLVGFAFTILLGVIAFFAQRSLRRIEENDKKHFDNNEKLVKQHYEDMKEIQEILSDIKIVLVELKANFNNLQKDHDDRVCDRRKHPR